MESSTFLYDLSIVMLIAGFVTLLFHWLRQPVVLGYILAGIIIGPNTPPFPLINDPESIKTLSQLGIVMLMFTLGLQLSFRGLVKIGPPASVAAIVEISLMVLLGYLLGRMLGWSWMDAVFLGAMLLSSSTVIIIKVLNDLNLVQARFARTIFGILVIDDMAAIIAIALLTGIALSGQLEAMDLMVSGGRLALFLTAVLVIGLLVMPRLLRFVARFKDDEVMLVLVLGMGFGMAILALELGLSTALGAFLLGTIIAETRQGARIRAMVTPVRDMFSAVFFISIGLLFDPALLVDHWLTILIVTVALIIGKTLFGALGALVAGNDLRTSLRVGLGLAQIGEFAFIIAVLGHELGATSDFLYPVAVSVAAISTLTTPYMIRYSNPIAAVLEKAVPGKVRVLMDLYTRWLTSLTQSKRQATQVRRLIRRSFMQMGLNLLLIGVIFVSLSALSGQLHPPPDWLPEWLEPEVIAFLAALLLSLPLMAATIRKLRATGMLMAEASIAGSRRREQVAVLRSLVLSAVVGGGVVIMALYILIVSAAIVPSWPILLGMLGVAVVVSIWRWRSFIRMYSRAQVALRDTLEAIDPPEPDPVPRVPTLLQKAIVQTVQITPESPAVGQLIRELQLRTVTGASIVGIERPDESQSIINPAPDEDIRAGDRLLLLGSREHLDAARNFLNGQPKDASV
ncbi:MAG: cation:proton antiporter [Phycisphaeraceae bacterium]|nr:cation:proton antiporter [Phycisphaeraceae bacterium]